MGMSLDELNEMYSGKADNRGRLRRDYDALKEENQTLRAAVRAALRGLRGDDRLAAARCSGKLTCGHCYALREIEKLKAEELLE